MTPVENEEKSHVEISTRMKDEYKPWFDRLYGTHHRSDQSSAGFMTRK
jgi:hypothetical protein